MIGPRITLFLSAGTHCHLILTISISISFFFNFNYLFDSFINTILITYAGGEEQVAYTGDELSTIISSPQSGVAFDVSLQIQDHGENLNSTRVQGSLLDLPSFSYQIYTLFSFYLFFVFFCFKTPLTFLTVVELLVTSANLSISNISKPGLTCIRVINSLYSIFIYLFYFLTNYYISCKSRPVRMQPL